MRLFIVVVVAVTCIALSIQPAEPVANPAAVFAVVWAGSAVLLTVALALVGLSQYAGSQAVPSLPAERRRLLQGELAFCFLWAGATLTAVIVSDWPGVVHQHLGLPAWWLARLAVGLAPSLVTLIGAWFLFGATWPQGETPAAGGRWTYVRLQVRHTLLIPLLPVFGCAAVYDLGCHLPTDLAQRAPALGALLTLAGMVAVFPLLLRVLWAARPLEPGPRRRCVEQVAHRAGVRVSQILLWPTQHRMRNAAVAGCLPSLRYLFVTDGLLSSLQEDEVEAVIAHEVAHLVYGHPRLLLTALLVPFCALGLTDSLLTQCAIALPVQLKWLLTLSVAGGWSLIYCRYARALEHQADWYACRLLAAESDEEEVLPTVERFLGVLQKMNTAASPGLRALGLHPAPERRAAVLRYLGRSTRAQASFEQALDRSQRLFLGIVVLLLTIWAMLLYWI